MQSRVTDSFFQRWKKNCNQRTKRLTDSSKQNHQLQKDVKTCICKWICSRTFDLQTSVRAIGRHAEMNRNVSLNNLFGTLGLDYSVFFPTDWQQIFFFFSGFDLQNAALCVVITAEGVISMLQQACWWNFVSAVVVVVPLPICWTVITVHLLIFFTPRGGHAAATLLTSPTLSSTMLKCCSRGISQNIHFWSSGCRPIALRKTKPRFLPSLSPTWSYCSVTFSNNRECIAWLSGIQLLFFFLVFLSRHGGRGQKLPSAGSASANFSLQAHPRLFTKAPSTGESPPPSC